MSLSAVSWWEPTVKCHGSTGAGCLRTGAKHKQRNCLSEMHWKHGFVLIHLKSRTILQSLYTTKFTNPWRKTEGNWLFLFFFSLSSNCFVLSVCEGAGKQTHLFTFIIFPFDSPRFSQPHLSIPLFWIGVFLTDVLWTVLFTLLYKSLLLNWSCYYFYCSCTVVVL